MHNYTKSAIIFAFVAILLFFGCTMVAIADYDPHEPIDGFDASALGYGNSTTYVNNNYFFLIDTYTYETKVNGTDYYKIVSKQFLFGSDANKNFNELSAGFTLIDTNYGRAAVSGNNGISYYSSVHSGSWVVVITAPDNNKATILAKRFTEKLRRGIKK